MHTVQSAVREFMNSDAVRSRARTTIVQQRLVLTTLIEEASGIAGTEPIARLSRAHIDATLNIFRDRGLTDNTLNTYRSALRRFGRWLDVSGYVKRNPTGHLVDTKHRVVRAKRKPISTIQAHRLIAVAESCHPRDGMTAELMLSTGLRESEVACLRWADVDIARGTGTAYRPKLQDDHIIHMTQRLIAALERWRAIYEERHGPIQSTWYIVPALAHGTAKRGFNRMNPSWPMLPHKPQQDIGLRVKRWLVAVGETSLDGRASHTLRRTAANMLYEKCGDIHVVKTFLGHSSVSMTELYLDIDAAQDKLRKTLGDFDF